MIKFFFITLLHGVLVAATGAADHTEEKDSGLLVTRQHRLCHAHPAKALPTNESGIAGEHFRILAFNPYLDPYLKAGFGEKAYNKLIEAIEAARYVLVVTTANGWGIITLHKTPSEALAICSHGEFSHSDQIEDALFAKFRHSRWICEAVPDSDFAKEIEGSYFVPQSHYQPDAAGEIPYLRPSNEELEKRQVISFLSRKGIVKCTLGKLCAVQKTTRKMHRSITMASLELGRHGKSAQLDSLDEEL